MHFLQVLFFACLGLFSFFCIFGILSHMKLANTIGNYHSVYIPSHIRDNQSDKTKCHSVNLFPNTPLKIICLKYKIGGVKLLYEKITLNHNKKVTFFSVSITNLGIKETLYKYFQENKKKN